MTRVAQLLSPDPLFFILNSYSTGLSASVMEYLLKLTLPQGIGGRYESGEIGLRTANGMFFPSGSAARWFSEE